MLKKFIGGVLFSMALLPAGAQDILDGYIRKGLDSNLALKQKTFDLQKAGLDLKRAEGLFYPQIGLNSQYTLANGGRTQDIPIGDLLNGVYSSLNQLTASNKFPQVSNQRIAFLPNDFHDTKVEVALPIINTDIRYNKQIKKELINNYEADILIYKRELVKSIRQAYYQYLQATEAENIYTNALALANENLRVSEKFVQNTMATKEVVLRAKAQASQVQSQLTAAGNNKQNAAAYFNFLINQPLPSVVVIDSALTKNINTLLQPSLDLPAGREELTKLKSAQKALETSLKMSQAYVYPRLNLFYNIGFQGFGFKFNNDQFYQLGGLQLQWNIFKGRDNQYKIKQSQIDIDAIKNQYDDVTHQLQLQVHTAFNDYRSALQALQSLEDALQSSRETYRFTERRYKEGQALQLELVDARTQFTNAAIEYSLGQLSVLNKAAELERVTASYKL
jgi:outer membrane protein